VLFVGASTWTSRPFLFGLLCFALTLLAAEGALDPRWLVPVGWLWVNTHGSFPLGVVAIVLLALGRRMDGERPDRELRALRWSIAGIAIGGVLNPVGPTLLAFPVVMLARSDVLSHIIEWQSPDFGDLWARVFLLSALVSIVAIARRPSYRAALPAAVFLGATLLAMRNANVAMLAFLPGTAAAMSGLGSIESTERRSILRPAALVLGVCTPLLVFASCLPGDVDLRGYPTAALGYLDQQNLLGGDVHVATQDYVGNLLELELGRSAAAFIDDRFELHDRSLVEDYSVLQSGLPGWGDVLDRRDVEVVLWERKSALGSLLLESPEWRVVYDDTTASRPATVDAEEWARAIDEKPFLVACRVSFNRCAPATP
jgi:hypothetical protein